MKITTAIARLLQGHDLTQKESCHLFTRIFMEQVTTAEIRSVLLLLARKGETAPEVLGCLNALQKLEPPDPTPFPDLMDTCGTGGDGRQSLNISTLAAFVIAGAGGKVAKHGNRGISSRCGSSDLIEALGIRLSAPKARMIESISKFGIGYFHAPLYHPVFSRMQKIRKQISTRTIFNLLGPLANPCRITCQILGVAQPEMIRLYAEILGGQKMRGAFICHSQDGLDEISAQVPTDACKIVKGNIIPGRIHPRKLGFRASRTRMPRIKSVRESRDLALQLLKNELSGLTRETILINAAAGLWISGKAKGLREGLAMADTSLRSGNAWKSLLGLRKLSNA